MAGETKAQGSVFFTPIIKISDSINSDPIEVIHHDIKGTLGGDMIYSATDTSDRWYYKANTDLTTDANLIAGNFTDAATAIASGDHVKFLFIKHTGTSDGTTAVTETALLTLDAGDPRGGGGETDIIEIGPGEAFQCKFKDGLNMTNIHAASSAGTVRCIVAAIIDDQ